MASELQWRGEALMQVIRSNLPRAGTRSALILQREMKRMLSRPGTGIHHPGLPRRSSAPGEPPAAQFASLKRSIQIDLSQSRRGIIRVGTNLPYGRHLEFGTRGRGAGPRTIGAVLGTGRGRIRPRPWARPSLAKARPRIEQEYTLAKLAPGFVR